MTRNKVNNENCLTYRFKFLNKGNAIQDFSYVI